MENGYIFILCPPYSGSTLLKRLLATSTNVSAFPTEGQFLPELKEVMRAHSWNEDYELPWVYIKSIWESYWDKNKPLFLEKSPPHILRADSLLQYFQPAFFLIMVRNPYALCEGLMRRNGWEPMKAAEFTIRCLSYQVDNANKLENSISFTYEELTDHVDEIVKKIKLEISGLGDINVRKIFNIPSIEGEVESSITNYNEKKIKNLSNTSVVAINEIFRSHYDLLDYWGYELLEER